MLDFNRTKSVSDVLTETLDLALQHEHAETSHRSYLGASRLGGNCDRALQYEFCRAPVDSGEPFQGRTLRIFEAGHVFEALAIRWLRLIGFDLVTEDADGQQFGFSAAGGRLRGHIDGYLCSGPKSADGHYPALWECKSLNNKSWKDTVKKGVAVSKPVYAAQIALYQAYMADHVPGIEKHSALFTAINKDTAELYFEWVPFDGALAQSASDRGVKLLRACDTHELLPRVSRDPCYFECQWCPWQRRCWEASGCA